MDSGKNVLLIGIDPKLVDFTPFPGFTAEMVLAALDVEQKRLIELGYSPRMCHTDLGETAEAVVAERFSTGDFDFQCGYYNGPHGRMPLNRYKYELNL